MLVITNKQVEKLDEIPIKIFLAKLEQIISEDKKEDIDQLENLKESINKYYYEAVAEGFKTERGIAEYIIVNILK